MTRSTILCIALTLFLLFMVSCSGGGGNVLAPIPAERDIVAESTGKTGCLGLWQVVIDKNAGTIEAVDLRSGNLILNVLGFMEPPALGSMNIDFSTLKLTDPTVEVDVIFTHPIPGDPVFMGFDVRGVVFGPDVTNADGLTILTGPEYFNLEPFGYIDGMLGAPDSHANYEGLAGYKYFCDGLGLNDDLAEFMSDPGNLDNRGKYGAGVINKRHYVLDWTGKVSPLTFLVFNYAVYANYNWPVGAAPITVDDFDITTANSAEAFCCSVTELANSLWYSDPDGGGSISLMVEIWDWQGDISNVTIECDDLSIPATQYDVASGPGTTARSYMFDWYGVAGSPTAIGEVGIIIKAIDPVTFGDAWFLNLLTTTNPMYNEKVYNCFIHNATVIECPPATVTAIDPDGGWAGQKIDDASVTGSFLDGASLAVKLTKTGESDIVAGDVKFVSDSEITCDLDLTGAAAGDWTVVVTNGCGVDGELVDGFKVKSCPNIPCPSASPTTMIGSNRLYYWPPQPVQSTDERVIACYSSAYRMSAINVTGTSAYFITNNNPTYSIYETCITSDDLFIYQDSGSTTHLYSAQYSSTGFSSVRASWGSTIPSGWYIFRLTIDADDNPIALCRAASNQARAYHWNGTDWGSGIDMPSTIMSECGNSYGYIQDFAYDSNTGYYYVTDRYSTHGVHAWDAGSNVVWQDTNIWSGGPDSTSWETGIFIDYLEPDCRLICMSGRNTSNMTTYWARYNNAGGGKTTGTTSGGTYGTTFSTFQGEGCVQIASGTARFLASTYGGNVWSSTIVPSW